MRERRRGGDDEREEEGEEEDQTRLGFQGLGEYESERCEDG